MKNFLIVDDSAVVRKVARRMLERFDVEISEAEDGEQGLNLCREAMPDGIIVDELMPQMNGCEFMKALRKLPGGDVPKVVFCTSEHDIAQIAKAKHCGADDYMLKPFDKKMMLSKLQEMGLV